MRGKDVCLIHFCPLRYNMDRDKQVEQRKAHQEMIGNMEEVVDSIRESAEKMGSRNNKNHELAEASLEQGREHARRLDEMDERDEAREAIRDAERKKRQQDFDARQDQAAAVAAKEVGEEGLLVSGRKESVIRETKRSTLPMCT